MYSSLVSMAFHFSKLVNVFKESDWNQIGRVLVIPEDGGNIGGSGIHFPSAPGKYLADLRSRANSQQYSSIYED